MPTDEVKPLSYGRQWIDESDIETVERILRSDWLTQGPAVDGFEAALATLTGAAHAVSVSSATAALHIACLALEIGPGDLVWTSPNSFVASANCALYCGADVDFVDIDPGHLCMSMASLAAKLAKAERQGRLPKLVIPVHFAGQSCDMQAIGNLAHQYGFRVVEDASHAVGGSYLGKRVGACSFSDICVFSFHPVKIITTAEGGAAMTNDSELARRLRLLRSHGITRDPTQCRVGYDGPWYYEQTALGFNYRLTDLQAALGSSQLQRIDEFIARRHELADHYDAELSPLPLRVPSRLKEGRSAMHLYVIQFDDTEMRLKAFNALKDARIHANVHYIPIHLQPYYRLRGFSAGAFPESEDYYRRALTLPLHPQLNTSDLDRVITVLETVLV